METVERRPRKLRFQQRGKKPSRVRVSGGHSSRLDYQPLFGKWAREEIVAVTPVCPNFQWPICQSNLYLIRPIQPFFFPIFFSNKKLLSCIYRFVCLPVFIFCVCVRESFLYLIIVIMFGNDWVSVIFTNL